MWRVAYGLLGDEAEASDALQESMLRLWNVRMKLDGVTNQRAYCMATVRNVALGMLDSGNRRMVPIDVAEDQASGSDVAHELEVREAVARVELEIGRMPESQREVMRMSSFGGLSNQEIAEATGMTYDNVRAVLSRGRRKLRELLMNSSK